MPSAAVPDPAPIQPGGRPRGLARRALLPALVVLLAVACGRPGMPKPGSVAWFLDGCFLAPPLQAGGPLLLCGRFEVTREEYQGGRVAPALADLPATGMDRDEAAAWARERGFRLPTLQEWRHLAAGGTTFPAPGYPWGGVFQAARANTLELGLHRALPVGVFELGRNNLGGQDFAGNVWEWVADGPPGAPDLAWACGGSYAAPAERAGILETRLLTPGDRAEDLGFRVVAEAAPWFLEQVVPLWKADRGGDRELLRRSFRRWRRDLRRLLAGRLLALGAPPELCAALGDGP